MNIDYAGKDSAAYERGDPCYIDEQGNVYARADFLAACNGDEHVARRLFDLCYWQSPQLQFELYDEGISVPELSHHSKREAHWLCFHTPPNVVQCELLRQAGWRAQDHTYQTWIIERDEAQVPTGIAYRETGRRDRTPQEVERLRQERPANESLTDAAHTRHVKFVQEIHTDMERLRGITCYKVEQVPENLVAWNNLENVNGHGLRALFLSSLAESAEELWQALDRLPANCTFIVTELTHLTSTAQVKARMQGGMIHSVRSREEQGMLIGVFMECAKRLKQEPLRKRLLRRWGETSLVRKERIEQEALTLEWVPFMHQITSDLFKDEAAQTIGAAKAVLGMMGWQSAYSYAMEMMHIFPDEIGAAFVSGFLADLEARGKAAKTHREKSDSEIYQEVEQGRSHAFTQLLQEAGAFLSPVLLDQDPSLVIVFEYDLTYLGGDYSDVGYFVSVPVSLIKQLGGHEERAFEIFAGYSRSHIIHFSNEEEAYDERASGPLKSQVPHQERLAHYATCTLCQGLIRGKHQ